MKPMTREKALRVLENSPGNDKVAKILALDPGTMIDVLMALNPKAGIVDIAKWHDRVTK